MSIPITECLVSKAAKGDADAINRLYGRMKRNVEHGSFSTYPCVCDPRCPQPSDEEIEALELALLELEKKELESASDNEDPR